MDLYFFTQYIYTHASYLPIRLDSFIHTHASRNEKESYTDDDDGDGRGCFVECAFVHVFICIWVCVLNVNDLRRLKRFRFNMNQARSA